ncbi:MAG: prolyl oligopeptidase family serine peptidase, partial [Clostridia bacterium]|nr:prolyl oligopeptidase family serine peptidase [Clostridia bacterium]
MITAQHYTTQKTRPMTFRYLLCTPDDMAPDEKLPLIVFLHGAGERGDDPWLTKVHGPAKRYDHNFPVRAILLCPQCAAEDVWYTQVHELRELIEHTLTTQPVDPNRVSLTGISMGGFGTWALAMAHPDLFSCIAPICGGGMAWNAGRLTNLPIRAFHGDCDSV